MKTVVLLVGVGLTILAIALFMPWLSNLGSDSPNSAIQASTVKPLHTSGHTILDSSNNLVYFRGIGRAGDLDSLSGTWGGRGENVFSYGEKWQNDTAALRQKMDETFACYRNIWKVNLVRILIPVDWWWENNINPAKEYGGGPDQLMSYRRYIELVVEEAGKYGVYVDLVPYEVRNYYVSGDNWDGIPGSLGTASLAYMHTINVDEMQAWRMWWTSIVNKLGKYPNVIFEMWNEPDDGSNAAVSPEALAYFSYAVEMYKTIRVTGNMNLIFMQWHASLVPGFTELDWVPQLFNQLKASLGSTPNNVAFTAHPYRRAPHPNLEWSTNYTSIREQFNLPNMIPATRSNGVDVPLVFNEMGIMADPSVYSNEYYPAAQQAESSFTFDQKMRNELSFFDAILQNAKDMGIGVCAFYWMQTGVWHGWEALVAGAWAPNAFSPTPSQAGKIFIDAY
ncbi:MAG: glycoside hydrolase family 5 protein [Candidatus Bathyarchaeota archaeon]|nr:glycoside hydrolase family 5 protein [Candidatus Bathyarchaeota archaeon]